MPCIVVEPPSLCPCWTAAELASIAATDPSFCQDIPDFFTFIAQVDENQNAFAAVEGGEITTCTFVLENAGGSTSREFLLPVMAWA